MQDRDVIENKALSIVYGTEGMVPAVSTAFAGLKTVSYATIRKAIRTAQADVSPEKQLKGDALSAEVKKHVLEYDGNVMAAVIQANRDGLRFTRCNGRVGKKGGRSLSISMSDTTPKSAKVKSVKDMSIDELIAELERRKEAAANKQAIEA